MDVELIESPVNKVLGHGHNLIITDLFILMKTISNLIMCLLKLPYIIMYGWDLQVVIKYLYMMVAIMYSGEKMHASMSIFAAAVDHRKMQPCGT